MLKISRIDSATQRRLVVEGKLLTLWVAELRSACEKARADLRGRELVIETKPITTISQEGENVILELMNGGIKTPLPRRVYKACGQTTDSADKQEFRDTSRRLNRLSSRLEEEAIDAWVAKTFGWSLVFDQLFNRACQ